MSNMVPKSSLCRIRSSRCIDRLSSLGVDVVVVVVVVVGGGVCVSGLQVWLDGCWCQSPMDDLSNQTEGDYDQTDLLLSRGMGGIDEQDRKAEERGCENRNRSNDVNGVPKGYNWGELTL